MIKRALGNPKIIILLRDPVERAYSAYLHLVRDNREYLSFEDGLKEEEERIRKDWQCMWHYKNRGMYYPQVKAFMEAFDRVKVFIYEDFKKNPLDLIKQACEFLEVDTSYKPADTHARYNASGIPRFRALNNIFLMKNMVQRTARKVGSALLTEDRWTKFRDGLRAKLYIKSPMKPDTRAYLQQVFNEDKWGHTRNTRRYPNALRMLKYFRAESGDAAIPVLTINNPENRTGALHFYFFFVEISS